MKVNPIQIKMHHRGKGELPRSYVSLLVKRLPTLRAAGAFKELEIQEKMEALIGAAGSPGLDLDTAIQFALEREAE